MSIHTEKFAEYLKYDVAREGQPLQRMVFVPHPLAGEPSTVLKQYVNGKDPTTGKPVMQEIIDALTKPLSVVETKTGISETKRVRLLEPDTEDNLRQLFNKNGWTDGLPIVLPTEDKVAEMLAGTNRSPDEVVGKMFWSYTVEQVAVNAVMAGAKPEYFPVILALAASETPPLSTSTSSMAGMAVVNGPIRKAIGMNYEVGALGPYNEANSTIGRAWGFIARNCGGYQPWPERYCGSVGNPLNFSNIVFAENEERSPWKPFHVRKGFKEDESVVSLFGTGWSKIDCMGAITYRPLHEEALILMKAFPPSTPKATFVMDPTAAWKTYREGFETPEELAEWLKENIKSTVKDYWATDYVRTFVMRDAQNGIEPYATWLRLPEDELIQPWLYGRGIETVVVGGETNAFCQVYDMPYVRSISIDQFMPNKTYKPAEPGKDDPFINPVPGAVPIKPSEPKPPSKPSEPEPPSDDDCST